MPEDRSEWSPELFTLYGLDPQGDVAGREAWGRIVYPADKAMVEHRLEQAAREVFKALGASLRRVAARYRRQAERGKLTRGRSPPNWHGPSTIVR